MRTFRVLFSTALLLASGITCFAQFSGYSSIGYGYHQNPLYNYERLPDQTAQAYMELSVLKEGDRSSWGFRYVGGLLTFNRFEDRNFYEHGLLASYKTRSMAKLPPANASEEDSTDEEQEVEETAEASVRDSTGRYFDLGFKLSARHDKPVRSDFDNHGGEVTSSYRFLASPRTYCRLTNSLTYRSYRIVSELSNINDQFSAEFGSWTDGGMVYGIIGSLGYKYYASSLYDTSRFESKRSFVEKPSGKGKPGGKELVPSEKKILLIPQENGSLQLAPGVFIRKDWSGESSLNTSFLYRWNPRWIVRYLAQQANASMMNEDIYNDFFSHQGPELHVRTNHVLPARIQVIVEGQIQLKTFSVPALTIAGEETGPKRNDLRTGIELYASRYFDIFGNMGLDLFFSASLQRNQSNDEYNDYSLYTVSGGVGVSF